MTPPARLDGHCLCGAVTVALEGADPHVELCHCTMCRRWGGAFYAGARGEGFAIEGEDAIAVFRSSDWGERAFCSRCGSHIWWRFLPTGSRSFHAGLFSDADGFGIEKEIFVDEQAAWSPIGGDHPRQTGAEVIAEAKAAGFEF